MPHGNKDDVNPLVFGVWGSCKWCINTLCWKFLVFSRKKIAKSSIGYWLRFEPSVAGKQHPLTDWGLFVADWRAVLCAAAYPVTQAAFLSQRPTAPGGWTIHHCCSACAIQALHICSKLKPHFLHFYKGIFSLSSCRLGYLTHSTCDNDNSAIHS